MSIDDDFIQTIIANPDDDIPRLVYADWLDEQADPRGEFIRIQCELAKMPEDDPRRWDLELRQGRLMRWYGWQWWPNPFRPDNRRPEFRRGFIEERTLMVVVEDFLAQPECYFRCYPFLEMLMLLNVEDKHLSALLALPILERVKKLDVSHVQQWMQHMGVGSSEIGGPVYSINRGFGPQKRREALHARFGNIVINSRTSLP